jgi:hypothetical protein
MFEVVQCCALLCRNLAAELGLTCIEAFKMDATTALQKSGAQAPADVQPGECDLHSAARLVHCWEHLF